MNSVIEYAERYTSLGWQVHPLQQKTKTPATRNGFKDASADPTVIKKWFQNGLPNLGIATGERSGIAIIDVDPKNDGLESFEVLKNEFGLDINTPTVKTGSGGFHLYYRVNGPTKSRNGLLKGIDVKADGGYVVAPPSIHPNGQPYEFSTDLPIDLSTLKPFPSEIVKKVDDTKKRTKSKSKSSSDKVLLGSRHDHLVSKMGRFRGLGLSEERIAEQLHFENSTACSPPLEVEEVAQIARSSKERTFVEVAVYAPHTDLGNAERLKAFCGHDALYVQKMEKWIVYDERRYLEDTGEQMTRLVKAMLRQAKAIEKQITKNMRRELNKHLNKSESIGRISAMIKLAQSEMPIAPEELNADPLRFNVLNGTIDLRTGKLLPHDQRDRITKLSPIIFSPTAKCPTWTKFLTEITNNSDELCEYLQRIVGYCLTGITKEQIFWILFGLGSNGKTTFIEVIRKIMGEYGRATDISTFTRKQSEQIRNDLARLFDARLVTSVEIQEGKALDESVIKQVTGGDPVVCRFLFKEFFEYVPPWKLFMVVNHLPLINGTDHGIWRRIKCIPFQVQFSDDRIDRNLLQKLEGELSGILNWAIEGCLRWQKDGLREPLVVTEAGYNYRETEDELDAFLIEHTTRGAEFKVSATELFQRFATVHKQLGQSVMTQKMFAQKMRIKGIERKRSDGGRYFYFGLKLRPKTF